MILNNISDLSFDKIKKNILYFFLIILVLLPSLIWIIGDNSIWLWDQSYYAESALVLHKNILASSNMSEIFNLFLKTTPSQAPGLVWISQFFINSSVKSFEITFLLINWSIVALSLFIFIKFMEVIKLNGIYILLGIIVIASGPMFVGLSHQYLVEPLQVLTVVYSLWIVSALSSKPTSSIIIHLLFVVFLILSSKVSTFIYTLAPLYLILKKLKEHPGKIFKPKSAFVWGLGFILLFLCLFIIGWYFLNYHSFMRHVINATINTKTAILFGHRDTILRKLFYWFIAIKNAFFLDINFIILAIVFLCFFMIHRKSAFKNTSLRFNEHFLFVKISIFQILVFYLIASLQINEETRFIYPIAPYFTFLILYLALNIEIKIVKLILIPIFILQLIIINLQSLSFEKYLNLSKQAWNLSWHRAIEEKKYLTEIINTTCSKKTEGSNILVGVNSSNFNTYSLSFYMAKKYLTESYKCTFSTGGFSSHTKESELEKIELENAIFFVTYNMNYMKLKNFNYPSEKVYKYIVEHWNTEVVKKNEFYIILKKKHKAN